ncbi:hypothetical protein CEXT_740531 [Caerostris extrusa]|uniref:Uncharacterized protein n=1 Tax=Caerostris extrusa TaxID=172846 RepID=A0AAV4YFR8_CAEEX|nr:hypothetical protein CEXT_740531 [Caerostris extrusa]
MRGVAAFAVRLASGKKVPNERSCQRVTLSPSPGKIHGGYKFRDKNVQCCTSGQINVVQVRDILCPSFHEWSIFI